MRTFYHDARLYNTILGVRKCKYVKIELSKNLWNMIYIIYIAAYMEYINAIRQWKLEY